jgi:nucleoid-associated protein YgaU
MMKQIIFLFFCTAFLLGGCSSAPRQELQATQKAVAQALAAGAPELAPTEYASASSALHDAEKLIARRKHKLASEVLALARAHARRAIDVSKDESAQRQGQAAPDKPKAKPRRAPKAPPKTAQAEVQADPPIKNTVPTLSLSEYAVSDGDTLWLIAARQEVYGDALLWPLLYRANRDQIRDPRQIYTGQVIDIPRDISPSERKDAIERAQASEIFPVEILLQHRSTSR